MQSRLGIEWQANVIVDNFEAVPDALLESL